MKEKNTFIGFVISFFVFTALFWSVWFIRAYAWVSYKEVTVKVLGSILIAVATAMAVSGYMLFYLARPSYLLAGRKKKMLIAMGSILAIMLINLGMFYRYQNYGYTVTVYASVEHKESEGGNYYFRIKDSENGSMIQFVCDQDTYQKLKEDGTRYFVRYRRLSFGKKKATLGYVDVNREEQKE